uniref:probable protein phosphatase 2C 2 n=1 Tax=Erigeron canadensis TaxID=72917 RepID=UPI001CB90706|nr:probable protein phosphatase 2C 2 [Erigeron canadensis]
MVSVAAVTEAMFYTHVDHHMHVPKVDNIEFVIESMPSPRTTSTTTFYPSIRSGSHTDIGPRRCNEDAHIHIDDLSKLFGEVYKWALPSSFYAIFDGHGGSEASSYVKQHAMSLFFQDADLQHITRMTEADFQDEMFVKRVERSHCKAFLRADQALADNECIDEYCGTTALTVLILGRRLILANAGDCRAVLCKKGVAVQMSQDHRPSCLQEKKRVEELGGFFEDGYLNGELAVTRALGDWHMKKSSPNSSPLIAEPEVKQMMLSEDDEFMIIGCDGIWDVMSNQEAVALVQRQLRQHNDPQRSAKELIDHALRLHTSDNLTAIVVCFSSYNIATTTSSEPTPPQRQPWRPKFRFNN